MRCLLFCLMLLVHSCSPDNRDMDTEPRPIQILFLGHHSQHHNSYEYAPILMRNWTKEGIHITYTEDPDDLNGANLNFYDGLILYANHDSITPEQETALLNFVRSGHGFVPIHCASGCFKNSTEYINMIGGQFQSHDTATFTTEITDQSHPVMTGLDAFSTWDETYIHHNLSDDRQVLMERVEGDHREPWTWVKTYGEGRVFYTAYGHDQHTWNNPGFLKLIKNGLLWAVGDRVHGLWEQYHAVLPEFVHKDRAQIPVDKNLKQNPQYQEPLSPEESKKLIQIPVGFKLELFASEPDVINPISMAWDEKGRLWVIGTVDYPNSVRNEDTIGDDQIKICEDTDGDGRADKFTVFADNLNIPTSMVFVNGGVLISQAPDFLFLKDTDGDDVADIRELVLSGWDTFDTHAGPSNLQYGLDNNIWGVVGYSGFKGTIDGQPFEFQRGIFRFDRKYGEFEKMGNTSNNTRGLGFTETNQVFASTANNTHSVFMGIPNRYYDNIIGLENHGSMKIDGHYAIHPVTEKVHQVDVHGGFTAAVGHQFYTARNYPEKYWNGHAMVTEPTGHLVHWAKIVQEGAGFVEQDDGNLIAGADEWFTPVEAKVGPDGNVWVADWYNLMVKHNPTTLTDQDGNQVKDDSGNGDNYPLRDKLHGRIWRIVPVGHEMKTSLRLDRKNTDQLISTLRNPNMFWRITAQRLLVERGKMDVAEKLHKLIANEDTDDIGNNPGALHALWTLDGLGVIDGHNQEALNHMVKALSHPAPAVRKAVIQILSQYPEGIAKLKKAEIWKDTDPEVRLAALLSVSTWDLTDELGQELYDMSQDINLTSDRWLSQALYIASSKHRIDFMKAYNNRNKRYSPKGSENGSSLTWTQRFLSNNWDGSVENTISDAGPPSGNVQKIMIGVVKSEIKYDMSEFAVKAGKEVEITFVNDDFMQHNLVISSPEHLETVGAAADKLATEPDGAERQYVPDLKEILHHTQLVDPEKTETLQFIAPDKPGEYPFVCTFPGHWRSMHGVMKVL